ncbi:uncharacterized protein TNCV_2919191 [Trichonephila clavipes]|nr:uncharacterized protein TNCV_2919191 [Trichonephila clavipes]
MNLNALKAQRKGLRTTFSNCLKKIESELAQELCNFETLSVLKIQFNDKFARMDSCQNAISETLLLSDDGEHLFAEDLEDAEIYREKFWELTTKIELKSQQCTVPSDKESRKFKLPKIELKKFNGEAKEYLTFWSQFQKIHEDRGIAAEDKMQYLLQSMEPGSKAERLVLSFPATAANYPKAIDQLKERFGREDLLVQIYVRDLLTLVMKNAATGRAKADLSLLYDELEMESCLPEEVLVAWERSRNHQTESEGSRSLEQLMNFLRQEVKGEEMVLLARTGLTLHQNPRKKDYHATQVNKVETTTAAALVNMDNPEMKTKSIPKSESSLSNFSKSKTVFLQTLCVIIRCQGQEKLIRAVIDSGSQSTYVSENVITHLKALPLRSETVIHALFGGSETKPKKHDIFPVEVSNLNKTYTCSFEALSEKMICGYIPKIEDKQVLNELKRKKIKFTDSFRKETEINLLIGADVLGKLLTGNSVELESGLTAVETKLGWTVFGKGSCVKDNIVTTLSMHSMNIPVNKLWELEVLGISSPTEIEKKQKTELSLNDFNNRIKILPDGRYEVELPWKIGKKLNIIERVPDLELNKECHYLAHRPVIKLDSQTTKIRPVFDASASEKGKPSLNECLLKGTNLIELIPDILDRFRMYPIGISADIEKAFLMLSVAPKDRDFLRFFSHLVKGGSCIGTAELCLVFLLALFC